MRPVRFPRPFPHVESESLLLLPSHRALEVNCRSTCSLSTCPALSHVSFLSFENPAPRETSVSVCLLQRSGHDPPARQPHSRLHCFIHSAAVTGEYFVRVRAPQANACWATWGETGMRKSLRKSSYYKVGVRLATLAMGRACLPNPPVNPGRGRSCILCPGRPRCLLP